MTTDDVDYALGAATERHTLNKCEASSLALDLLTELQKVAGFPYNLGIGWIAGWLRRWRFERCDR